MERLPYPLAVLRLVIAAALIVLTAGGLVCAAQADRMTIAHFAAGAHETADGGWSAPCDRRYEPCDAAPRGPAGNVLAARHHHHHAAGAFTSLPAAQADIANRRFLAGDFDSCPLSRLESASPPVTDQPPKA